MSNPIKRIFDLYTSDLSFDEIQRLIKKESAEVYEFFAADIPKSDRSRNKIVKFFLFLRNLFNAFIMKLTPARRIFYLIAVFFFFVGYIQLNTFYLISGFLIINALLAFEVADKLATKNELDLARKIQNTLLPQESPVNKNYKISFSYESAREVGGDYIDFFTKNEDELVVIGDISGKGIAAALYMVRVQAILNLLTDKFDDLKEVVVNLKKYFSTKLSREFFLTLTSLKIFKDGRINMIRAGHPPILQFVKSRNEIIEVSSKGMGIGFNDKGLFEKTLEVVDLTVNEGDILLLYTDGITEAMNEAKIQYGIERVKKVILSNSEKSVEELKTLINRSIKYFVGQADQTDDITFIVLKRETQSS